MHYYHGLDQNALQISINFAWNYFMYLQHWGRGYFLMNSASTGHTLYTLIPKLGGKRGLGHKKKKEKQKKNKKKKKDSFPGRRTCQVGHFFLEIYIKI